MMMIMIGHFGDESFQHSCTVRIIRIIRPGKNSRILTNFIMDMNVQLNNYAFQAIACAGTDNKQFQAERSMI